MATQRDTGLRARYPLRGYRRFAAAELAGQSVAGVGCDQRPGGVEGGDDRAASLGPALLHRCRLLRRQHRPGLCRGRDHGRGALEQAHPRLGPRSAGRGARTGDLRLSRPLPGGALRSQRQTGLAVHHPRGRFPLVSQEPNGGRGRLLRHFLEWMPLRRGCDHGRAEVVLRYQASHPDCTCRL